MIGGIILKGLKMIGSVVEAVIRIIENGTGEEEPTMHIPFINAYRVSDRGGEYLAYFEHLPAEPKYFTTFHDLPVAHCQGNRGIWIPVFGKWIFVYGQGMELEDEVWVDEKRVDLELII